MCLKVSSLYRTNDAKNAKKSNRFNSIIFFTIYKIIWHMYRNVRVTWLLKGEPLLSGKKDCYIALYHHNVLEIMKHLFLFFVLEKIEVRKTSAIYA